MKYRIIFLGICFLLSCSQGTLEKSAQASLDKTCDNLRLEFDKGLPAVVSCRQDKDCVCFQGGLSLSFVCGGMTNQETINKLSSNIQKQTDLGCGFTALCSPWECAPLCKNGVCSLSER